MPPLEASVFVFFNPNISGDSLARFATIVCRSGACENVIEKTQKRRRRTKAPKREREDLWKEDKGEEDNDGDLLAPFSDPIDIERPRARTLSLCVSARVCVRLIDGWMSLCEIFLQREKCDEMPV